MNHAKARRLAEAITLRLGRPWASEEEILNHWYQEYAAVNEHRFVTRDAMAEIAKGMDLAAQTYFSHRWPTTRDKYTPGSRVDALAASGLTEEQEQAVVVEMLGALRSAGVELGRPVVVPYR